MRLGLVAGVLLVGCSDGAEDVQLPPSSGLAAPPVGEGLQLSMRAQIGAGVETEYCQYVVLPEAVDVREFEHAYSPGSHHLLLYMTTLEASEVTGDLERFECASRDDLRLGGIAYAAQVPAGQTAFPEGVAMRFEKSQVLMVQSHYLNTTADAVDADVRLNLWKSQGAVEQEAGTLFFYDYSIVVPPHSEASAKMRCEIGNDLQMSFAMSHMHRRGVGYRSQLVGGGQDAVSLYETDRWEGVEPVVMDPPLQVKAGQTIEFECDYRNDSDEAIIEGPSGAKNEMCMFVATYWPRLDLADEFCSRPGSGPVHDGDTTCAETLECFQSTTDAVAREQCQVRTCAGASPALADFNHCLFFNCPACPDEDGCESCIAAECLAEYQGCQASTCD
jgi:hypothetical protein